MFNKDLMEEHDGHSARVGVTCLKGATFWDTVMYLAAGRISHDPQDLGFSGSYCIACWGVGEGWWGGGWWRSLHVHTCETLRNCCVALAHMFDATPLMGCIGGVGMMTFRACDMWDATQLMGWVGGGWWWCPLPCRHFAHWLCTDRKLPRVCFRRANASKNLCGKLKTPQRPSTNKTKTWLTPS